MKTLEETFVDKVSNNMLTDFSENIANEGARLNFMKKYQKNFYDDLENVNNRKPVCSICGHYEPDTFQPINDSSKSKDLEESDNVTEGFIGTGPGEYKLPEDPKTKNKCCPACFKAIVENGQKKCKQVCLHGDYQDYNCLSEEAYKSLIYGDDSAKIIGSFKKQTKTDKIKIEKEKLELKLNDPMITEEEKDVIENKIEHLDEEIEELEGGISNWTYLFGTAATIVSFIISRKSFDLYTSIIISLFIGLCFGLIFWFGDHMNKIAQSVNNTPITKKGEVEMKIDKKEKKEKKEKKKIPSDKSKDLSSSIEDTSSDVSGSTLDDTSRDTSGDTSAETIEIPP